MSTHKPTYSDIISVIMPTYKRPHDLPRALGSLIAQQNVPLPIEIIVADNDPKASAKDTVQEISASTSLTIHYLHVPIPGVSNVRNKAIAIAKGRYIAWLDDDQEAAPNWLAELYKTAQTYQAALVFCPSPPKLEISTSLDEQYIRFFARKAPAKDGLIKDFYGCGNSLLDRKLSQMPDPIFDPAANETGGEDDILFSYIQRHGGKTAWTSETFVYEHVPASRTTPTYVRKRGFAWGQGPSEIAYDERDWLGIVRWMIIGGGQLAVYSVPLLFSYLLKRPSYIHWTSKVWQGAGKLFWYRGFRPRLYGQASAVNKASKDGHRASKQVQS